MNLLKIHMILQESLMMLQGSLMILQGSLMIVKCFLKGKRMTVQVCWGLFADASAECTRVHVQAAQ